MALALAACSRLAASRRRRRPAARSVRDQRAVRVSPVRHRRAVPPRRRCDRRRAVLRHRQLRRRRRRSTCRRRASSTAPARTSRRCTRSPCSRRTRRGVPGRRRARRVRRRQLSRRVRRVHRPRLPHVALRHRERAGPTRRRGTTANVAWSARSTTPTSPSSPARRSRRPADHSPLNSGGRRSWNAVRPSRRSSLSHARLNAAATSASRPTSGSSRLSMSLWPWIVSGASARDLVRPRRARRRDRRRAAPARAGRRVAVEHVGGQQHGARRTVTGEQREPLHRPVVDHQARAWRRGSRIALVRVATRRSHAIASCDAGAECGPVDGGDRRQRCVAQPLEHTAQTQWRNRRLRARSDRRRRRSARRAPVKTSDSRGRHSTAATRSSAPSVARGRRDRPRCAARAGRS